MPIGLDAAVLAAFAGMKGQSDPLIVGVAFAGLALVFALVGIFLARKPIREDAHSLN